MFTGPLTDRYNTLLYPSHPTYISNPPMHFVTQETFIFSRFSMPCYIPFPPWYYTSRSLLFQARDLTSYPIRSHPHNFFYAAQRPQYPYEVMKDERARLGTPTLSHYHTLHPSHVTFCPSLAPPRQKVIREILTASRMSCLKLKGLESQRAQWLLPL